MKDIKIDEDKDSDDEESNSDVDDKETKSKKIAKEKKEKAKQDKKEQKEREKKEKKEKKPKRESKSNTKKKYTMMTSRTKILTEDCSDFLIGKCSKLFCDKLHNYSKLYKKENNLIFNKNFSYLKTDFSLLLPA